eukprot:PhF_6_TR26152/c0_g1_i2/m.37066
MSAPNERRSSRIYDFILHQRKAKKDIVEKKQQAEKAKIAERKREIEFARSRSIHLMTMLSSRSHETIQSLTSLEVEVLTNAFNQYVKSYGGVTSALKVQQVLYSAGILADRGAIQEVFGRIFVKKHVTLSLTTFIERMKFLKHRAKSHNSKHEELIRLFESLGGNLSDDSLSKKQFAEHLKEFGLEFNEMAQVTETGDLMDPEEYDEFTNVKEEKIAPEAATISANHLKDDDVFLEGKKPFSSFLQVPHDSDVHSAGVKSASDDEKDPFQSTLSRRMTERFLDGLMLSSSE